MLSQWLQQARNGRSVWFSDVRRDCETLPEHVAVTMQLTLTDGSLSRFIESLKLGKMVKYEYVPDFQAALYAPKPLQPASAK